MQPREKCKLLTQKPGNNVGSGFTRTDRRPSAGELGCGDMGTAAHRGASCTVGTGGREEWGYSVGPGPGVCSTSTAWAQARDAIMPVTGCPFRGHFPTCLLSFPRSPVRSFTHSFNASAHPGTTRRPHWMWAGAARGRSPARGSLLSGR